MPQNIPARIPSLYNQYYFDYNVDFAIIQIGANIIDQFDSDNFPTRVLFNGDEIRIRCFAALKIFPISIACIQRS